MGRNWIKGLMVALLALWAATAWGQGQSEADRQAEAQAAYAAAVTAAQAGPAEVALIDQGRLALAEGYLFVPKAEAARLMRAFGNSVDDQFVGLVLPKAEDQYWFITIDFVADGYVEDSEAQNWDADALLQTLKDGTAAANVDRVQRGFPAVEVLGWVERPAYDPASHRLVWSTDLQEVGAPTAQARTVNYNTYALGREGYFSLDLVTSSETVVADKAHAQAVLASLSYGLGKSYADYIPGSDTVAAYGIGALVAGVAAKKLGLLALAGVMLVKFGKVIAVAAVAALWGLRRLFRRKPEA